MTAHNLRNEAIRLRMQGLSFSHIKEQLKLPNSTLQRWLYDYPLTELEIQALPDLQSQTIERYRNTMSSKRTARLYKVLHDEANILPFSRNELYIAGLFLYWGEGSKSLNGPLSLSNTDPDMIRFFLMWLINCLGIPRSKIKVQLHLYKDMEVSQKISFWSKHLDMPTSSFNKPYIKDSLHESITHRGFSHGTCNISVSSIHLKEKVMMQIQAISQRTPHLL